MKADYGDKRPSSVKHQSLQSVPRVHGTSTPTLLASGRHELLLLGAFATKTRVTRTELGFPLQSNTLLSKYPLLEMIPLDFQSPRLDALKLPLPHLFLLSLFPPPFS